MLGLLAILAVSGIGWYLLNGERPVVEPRAAEMTTTQAEGPPFSRHIYSETADPKADIDAALSKAAQEHKRVIVDFGGDWCIDCQVLEIYMHQAPNLDLLAQHFLVVHVWVGHEDANLDIAAKYGIPIGKGVPALAVLNPDGEVVYAQRSREFEKMSSMDPRSVTEFLEKWKS